MERGVLGEFIFELCQQSRGEWEPPLVGSALQPFDASAEIGEPGSALEWVREALLQVVMPNCRQVDQESLVRESAAGVCTVVAESGL